MFFNRLDYMHRQPESNLDTLPKIVAHPVGYNEAIKFMEYEAQIFP